MEVKFKQCRLHESGQVWVEDVVSYFWIAGKLVQSNEMQWRGFGSGVWVEDLNLRMSMAELWKVVSCSCVGATLGSHILWSVYTGFFLVIGDWHQPYLPEVHSVQLKELFKQLFKGITEQDHPFSLCLFGEAKIDLDIGYGQFFINFLLSWVLPSKTILKVSRMLQSNFLFDFGFDNLASSPGYYF
jgi:hypothetical protein